MLLEILTEPDVSALLWERLDSLSRTRLVLSSPSSAQVLAQHITKIRLVIPRQCDANGTQKLLEVLTPIAEGYTVEAPPLAICFWGLVGEVNTTDLYPPTSALAAVLQGLQTPRFASLLDRLEEVALGGFRVDSVLTGQLMGVCAGRRFTTLRVHSCLLIKGAFEETETGGVFRCTRLFLTGYQHRLDSHPLHVVRSLRQLTYLEYDGEVGLASMLRLAGAWPDLLTLNLPGSGLERDSRNSKRMDHQWILSKWPKLQHLSLSSIHFSEEGVLNLAPLKSLTISMMQTRDLARLSPIGTSPLVKLRVVGIKVFGDVIKDRIEEQMTDAVTRLLEYGAVGDAIGLNLCCWPRMANVLAPLGKLAYLVRTVYLSGWAGQSHGVDWVGQVLGAHVRVLLADSALEHVVGHLRHFPALEELYVYTGLSLKTSFSYMTSHHPDLLSLKTLKLLNWCKRKVPPEWIHCFQNELGDAVKVVWLGAAGSHGVVEKHLDMKYWCQRVLSSGCGGLLTVPGPLAHPWSLPDDHGVW